MASAIPLMAMLVMGCGANPASFVSNEVYVRSQEFKVDQIFSIERKSEIQTVLESLFGTPDEPQTTSLGEIDVTKVLDKVKLHSAAGAVGRDADGKARGLYREHCAHCHGVSGDGAGPTAAFLNPYPRDYRMGVFKFKSTPKGSRPSHDDLKRILVQGIPGTAMPSFKLLTEDELESLIHYVRYLSIRGELERNLIQYCAADLDESDRLIDVSLRSSAKADEGKKYEEQLENIRTLASEVVDKWIQAEVTSTTVPARTGEWRDPQQLVASRKKGRDLFYGVVANCIKCHGDSALGDGTTNDFDDWTKELEPANTTRLAEYTNLGALEPRNIRPRNLRLGVYRGGRRPIDLYWRIRNGIDGTPMPGVLMQPANPKGLTEEDIWSLVDYVRSLPFESISRPPETAASVHRERM